MRPFTDLTLEAAPGAARPDLDALARAFGFAPNLAVGMVRSPGALGGYVAGLGALDGGALGPVERQLVMVAVSRANEADYGVAVHSTVAAGLGATREAVSATRGGQAPADPLLAALLRFAREVTLLRGPLPPGELDAFLAAGFGEAEAVEVAWAVAMKHFANTVGHLARPPLDAGFAGTGRGGAAS